MTACTGALLFFHSAKQQATLPDTNLPSRLSNVDALDFEHVAAMVDHEDFAGGLFVPSLGGEGNLSAQQKRAKHCELSILVYFIFLALFH